MDRNVPETSDLIVNFNEIEDLYWSGLMTLTQFKDEVQKLREKMPTE